MPAAPEAPSAPAPAAPASGDLPIPQISSMNEGAQGVRPAPAGTIPPSVKPFSEKPQSAMSKVRERLRSGQTGQAGKPAQQKAPEAAATPKPEAKPEPETKPSGTPDPEGEEDLMDSNVGAKEEPKAAAKEAPKTEEKKDDQKKEKANPWKMFEEQKSARAKAEQELAEVRKLVADPEKRKAEVAELEALKKRNLELEQHMQFVDYKASNEFKDKYEKPYKDQWRTSMAELNGIVVQTDEGDRAITPQDLVDLVNIPRSRDAQKRAEEMFGEDAGFVMKERDKIREIWDSQEKALEEAKTRGMAKNEEMTKASRESFEKMNGEVRQIYDKAMESITKDPKVSLYITPKEGDSKHNEILTKGLAMVDEAFSLNPMDPSHTPEKRASIVKKHAAVRLRAAGYGVLKHHMARIEARNAELEAKLAEYEGTVPTRGGSQPTVAQANGGTAMDRMKARLRARSVKV